MKKTSFFVASLLTLLTIDYGFAASTTLAQDYARIKPLPRACLPEKERMIPQNGNPISVNDVGKTCHCPPQGDCDATITYNGKVFPKLPQNIQSICCTPPPPPPACSITTVGCNTVKKCPSKPDVVTPISPKPAHCTTPTPPPICTQRDIASGCKTEKTCDGVVVSITDKSPLPASCTPTPSCTTTTDTCTTTTTCPGTPITVTTAPIIPKPTSCTEQPPIHGTPESCEVHYFKSTNSTCADKTFIGVRLAQYCIKYQYFNTDTAIKTSITSLNNCLANNCQQYRTAIKGSTQILNPDNLENNVIRTMTNQISLKQFVDCRRTCFSTNRFNDGINGIITAPNQLMQDEEIRLNKWIKLDLHDNITDQNVVALNRSEDQHLTEQYGLKDGEKTFRNFAEKHKGLNGHTDTTDSVKAFSAKTFGPLINTTVNQKDGTFNLFFENTYHPDKHPMVLTNVTYKHDLGNVDANFLDGTRTYILSTSRSRSQDDYFYETMEQNNPKWTNLPTADHDRNPPVLNYNNITCGEYDYIGMCITYYTNNASCHTCLAPETKITLGDGTTQAIKSLKIGDNVKTPYGKKEAMISKITQIEWKELELYTINKGQLRLTADHPIMTKKGWRAVNYKFRDDTAHLRYGLKKVKTLQVGDVMITENGEVPVTSIMPEAPIKDGKTYNLKLKGNIKGFYANGIWVRTQK